MPQKHTQAKVIKCKLYKNLFVDGVESSKKGHPLKMESLGKFRYERGDRNYKK